MVKYQSVKQIKKDKSETLPSYIMLNPSWSHGFVKSVRNEKNQEKIHNEKESKKSNAWSIHPHTCNSQLFE
ncbi:hypothetical protein K440DRAFT_419151 [Wilcoxina mikolae CBS 423.85]|nr:hypothetical protein K440DRAFT_419151 [Wilcoxina mikolae CBS 423.85]